MGRNLGVLFDADKAYVMQLIRVNKISIMVIGALRLVQLQRY